MKRTVILALASLVLVSCEPTVGTCPTALTGELRTVDRLIAETRANLERGYTLERQGGGSVDLCLGGASRNVGLSFCSDGSARKPVAIDRAAEQRKLDGLLARREQLAAQVAVCAGGSP